MFENLLVAELATRVGSSVEISLDDRLIEGVLSSVSTDLIIVIQISGGYGPGVAVAISIQSINSITFPQVA